MDNTVNIYPGTPADGKSNEVIIREGQALELKPPTQIIVNGVLKAPAQFFEKKKDNYEPQNCHVLINKSSNTVSFVANDRDAYKDKVTGYLLISNELDAFQINQPKKWSIAEFRTFLRTVKFFFASPEEHAALLKSLESFSMNVSKTFENINNNSGNSRFMIETEVNKIPFKNEFILNIPLFKGYPKESFTVEIGIDPTSNEVKLFLVSSAIYELIEAKKETYIKEAIAIFEEFGCSIIEVV